MGWTIFFLVFALNLALAYILGDWGTVRATACAWFICFITVVILLSRKGPFLIREDNRDRHYNRRRRN